jgi:zinc protease
VNRKTQLTDIYNTGEIRDIIYDNIHFPGLFMAYRIPKENSKEHYVFDVLSDILSTGESSRFYKTLVYEKQLVSDIGCYIDSKELTGAFYIYAILMPGIQVNEVETEIEKILNDVSPGNITINELAKIKNRVETRYAYRMQSIVNKADMLAHYKTFYNNPLW